MNRLGIFKVTKEFIKEGWLPEVLYKLNMTPLAITNDVYYDLIVYKFFCKDIDEVKEGNEIPLYSVSITRDFNDLKKFELIKCL